MQMIIKAELVKRYIEPAALWLCLVLPSVFSVRKYFGWLGVGGYFVLTAGAVWAIPRLRWKMSKRDAMWFSLATFAILGAIFAIGYSIVNVHIPEMGSDDDDAMNIAVFELLHGRYPYYARTYLGNLIHHLPGAVLLAAPFVLLGTSALQNLFWLALFFFVLRRELSSSSAALRWFWLMLIFSPIVVFRIITGTGHVTNAIYVMLGLWWLVNAKHKTLPAAAWGVALSSRANFLLLIPLPFGWLVQRQGWNAALKSLLLTCIVCAIFTLPFYFYDPQGFAPLEASDRLTRFNDVLPYTGWAIGIGMAALSFSLALRPMQTSSALWLNCALVQAFPVITGYFLGRDLVFLTYGSFFLSFGILAAATHETK